MGYQLISAYLAGTRTRGTASRELRALFESMLNVRSVYEELKCCREKDFAVAVADELRRSDYDVAGVLSDDPERLVGWVERTDLSEGLCGAWTRRIEPHQVLSDSTPLTTALHVLVTQPWAFVIAGHGVAGIMTRSDLQKPPMRALIFGLLSLLEIHMTFWINHFYPDGSWARALTSSRVNKAKELFDQRAARNEELSLLDCLQIGDKKTIISCSEQSRSKFGLLSKNEAVGTFGSVERLRDRVSHSQDLVTGSSWGRVSEDVRAIEKMLAESDDAVEVLKKHALAEPND